MSIHAKQHGNVAVEGAASGVRDGFVHNLFTHLITVPAAVPFIEIYIGGDYNYELCIMLYKSFI